MSGTDQLYNDEIVRIARSNHGGGRLAGPQASVTCDNPLCGDRVTIDVAVEDGRLVALAQKTRGCLLTQAAASLLGKRAAGLQVEEIAAVRASLKSLLGGDAPDAAVWPELAMFTPVRAVRSRHGCVLLPFDAACEACGVD